MTCTPVVSAYIYSTWRLWARWSNSTCRNGVVYSLPSFRFIHPIFRCINRYINHPIALMKRLERISYKDIWGIIMDTFWGEFGITFHQPQNSWEVKPSSYRSTVKRHLSALWNRFWKHMSSNKTPGNTKDGITSASMMRLMGPSNLFWGGQWQQGNDNMNHSLQFWLIWGVQFRFKSKSLAQFIRCREK